VVLPIVLILTVALTITGLAFLNAGVMEHNLASREVYKNQAFYLAEAGLERTLWNLKEDYESGDRDWSDGDLNGVTLGGAVEGWSELIWPPVEPDLGPGTYLVRVKVIDANKLWIRSWGKVKDKIKVVQALARIMNASPWNNAIFARGGGAGGVVEGNALAAGSIHILGEGLTSTDFAMDISGTAGMRNNYNDMALELLAKVPPCPQASFNGEMIDSLGAELRVKIGKVGLSGTATIGEADVFGNLSKETADGVYVSDGYGGNQGELNVSSDNGTGEPYDMGAYVPFPSLMDPYPGYATYLDYLYDNALLINENKISSTVADFSHGPDINGNSISWNQSEGKLTINGLIRVNGDFLDLGEEKFEAIEYSGEGTILVARDNGGIVGSIQVHGDLVAEGTYSAGLGFPHNALGLIAGELALAPDPGESQLMMTGAFFAENKVTSRMQNEIAGSFVTSWFDVADQVPRLYQVPDLALNLPPFMPGGSPDWYLIVGEWSELPPEGW